MVLGSLRHGQVDVTLSGSLVLGRLKIEGTNEVTRL